MANLTESFTGSDGDPPDTNDWEETDVDSKLSIQSNQLNFNSSDAAAQLARISSKFHLSGDFDITIDWAITSLTNPSAVSTYFSIGVYSGSEHSIVYRQRTASGSNRYAIYGSSTPWTTDVTSHTSGKFRITRSGDVIKGYIWSGSQWEWDGSTSGFTFSEEHEDDVYIDIYFAKGADGTLDTDFDNLDVTSDSIYWESLHDLSLDIAAYYQKIEDLSTWLGVTDGTILEDLMTDLAAYKQNMDDLPSWLGAAIENTEDLQSWLGTLATHYDDLKTDLAAHGQALADLPAWLGVAANKLNDLKSWIGVTDGIILEDLGSWIGVTDGTVLKDLSVWVGVISAPPAFRSITAHRVSSVVHEVS